MRVEELTIYPFIKDDQELCRLYSVQAGDYIVRTGDEFEAVWVVVSGMVKVETTGLDGKTFRVDTLCEDNFVGHLSNISKQNFYCDSVAMEPSTLLRIPIVKFHKLMENNEFALTYLRKVNARLYEMYKKDLVTHLFTQKQQFAFFVRLYAKDRLCTIGSVNQVCGYLRISRRNFYNLVDKFYSEGVIERLQSGDIYVVDEEKLIEISDPVWNFYHNLQ